MTQHKLVINGQDFAITSDPQEKLLWVLRDELGLTGTKYGCGIGLCGACTVHVDGQAVRSCLLPVSAIAEGQTVRTIEGLATTEGEETIVLHPVQQAFLETQAPQCGWCMSGQIMSAVALLEHNPAPAPDEITAAMQGNLCRCGTYHRIRLALAKAVQGMQGT